MSIKLNDKQEAVVKKVLEENFSWFRIADLTDDEAIVIHDLMNTLREV